MRGSWAGSARLAADAVTALRLLRGMYPGRPIYLLGESMGGAVATLAATGAIHGVLPSAGGTPVADVDGVILSAPAVWGRQIMDLLPKIALWAGVRFLPGTVLTGQGLKIQASDNIPMLQALGRDPLVIKGSRIDTIYGLVNLMDSTIEAAPRFTAPLLLMYGKQDQIIPAPAIESFVAALPPEPDTRRKLAYYEHGYHLLLRDLEGPAVAEDVASWIFDHARPLPSHADAPEDDRPWPPHGDEEGGNHG
jgi:alpha-beta hydrolase superfamily lysophospholipase